MNNSRPGKNTKTPSAKYDFFTEKVFLSNHHKVKNSEVEALYIGECIT